MSKSAYLYNIPKIEVKWHIEKAQGNQKMKHTCTYRMANPLLISTSTDTLFLISVCKCWLRWEQWWFSIYRVDFVWICVSFFGSIFFICYLKSIFCMLYICRFIHICDRIVPFKTIWKGSFQCSKISKKKYCKLHLIFTNLVSVFQLKSQYNILNQIIVW